MSGLNRLNNVPLVCGIFNKWFKMLTFFKTCKTDKKAKMTSMLVTPITRFPTPARPNQHQYHTTLPTNNWAFWRLSDQHSLLAPLNYAGWLAGLQFAGIFFTQFSLDSCLVPGLHFRFTDLCAFALSLKPVLFRTSLKNSLKIASRRHYVIPGVTWTCYCCCWIIWIEFVLRFKYGHEELISHKSD